MTVVGPSDCGSDTLKRFLIIALVATLLPHCLLHPLFSLDDEGDDALPPFLLESSILANSTRTVLRYGYVANQGDASVGMYSIDDSTGIWTAQSPSVISTGGANTVYLVTHPAQPFLYAANQSSNNVSMFRIGNDGQLAQLSPFHVNTSGSQPIAIAVHPSGLYGYIGFNATSAIETYDIDPVTGQWTFSNSLPGCSGARELEIHPNTNLLYALCSSGQEIRIHTISNGSLTYIGNASSGGSQPNGLTITSDGLYLYVTSQGNTTVQMYSVNSTSGALTSLTPPSVGTDTWPAEVVVDPQSRFLFINCWQAAALTVRMYTIASDGQLSDNSPSSVPTGGSGPIHMDIDPTGRYVYVSNSVPNNINMYSIGSDGILTSNGFVSTGSGPRGIAFYTELVAADAQ